MRAGPLLLVASLTALAAASLPPKAALQAEAPATGSRGSALADAAEDAAERLLTEKGWEAAGQIGLTADGMYPVRRYRAAFCDGALYVGAITPNGETAAMLGRLRGADGRLGYVWNGRIAEEPPFMGAYVLSKIGPILQRLGVMDDGASRFATLAVVGTGTCAAPDLLPWPRNDAATS